MNTALPSGVFELSNIWKGFAKTTVLRGLSVKFERGDFALLLGANGAGKSTFLRICAGLARPDHGTLPNTSTATTIGHVGHNIFLYGDLTVYENLLLHRKLAKGKTELASYIDVWELGAYRDRKLFELSKGLQQRVSLARAFLHDPDYFFLDEPTSALDDNALLIFLKMIEQKLALEGAGGFVVIATHDIARLLPHANRLLVLQDGVISRDTSKDRIQAPQAAWNELRDSVLGYYRDTNR